MNKTDILIDKAARCKSSHFWLFLILLTLLSIGMMQSYNLHVGHDFHFHLRRFQALIDALANGNFPSYVDYGAVCDYGYLSKAFYCDVLLIPFACIGIYTDVITAYKIMLLGMTIITGICAYAAVNGIYKNTYAATVSALLYTFAYYRIVDVYRRAALGESWAFAFVPIICWGLYLIISGDYRKWYVLALGYSFMIFAHVLSTVLMAVTTLIVLAIYYKPLIKEPKRILYLLVAAIACIILTAYYIWPMLEQLSTGQFYFQTVEPMKAENFKMEPYRIVWGLFLGIVYPLQGFIPGVGILLIWGLSLRLFVREKSAAMRSIDIAIIVSLVYIFAQSWYFPWQVFPFNQLNFIQFPWRLNLIVSFFLAVAGGYCFSRLLVTKRRMLVGLVSVSAFIGIVLVSDGQCYNNENNGRALLEKPNVHSFYHIIGAEYMPSEVPSPAWLEERGNRIAASDSATITGSLSKKDGITLFALSLPKEDKLELPLVYYKGYKATVNNADIAVGKSNKGLLTISPSQSGVVKVYYAGTFVQKCSTIVSLLAFASLFVYICLYNRRKKQI